VKALVFDLLGSGGEKNLGNYLMKHYLSLEVKVLVFAVIGLGFDF
jgi:hypothetical protein